MPPADTGFVPSANSQTNLFQGLNASNGSPFPEAENPFAMPSSGATVHPDVAHTTLNFHGECSSCRRCRMLKSYQLLAEALWCRLKSSNPRSAGQDGAGCAKRYMLLQVTPWNALVVLQLCGMLAVSHA